MATLTTFRSELAAVLGLDNSTGGDQTQMDAYINEGVVDVLMRTQSKVLPFTMALTAGTADYTLSTSILAIIDLNIASSTATFPITRVTPTELLRLRLNTSAAASPSQAYAVDGANMLMVYPTPAAADTLTGIYVPRPTTLSSGSDTPSEIPAEWHKLVSFYALYRAADMDDDASSEQGERYRGLYEMGIREMRKQVYRHGGSNLPRARVNFRRRRLVAHDNSTDY